MCPTSENFIKSEIKKILVCCFCIFFFCACAANDSKNSQDSNKGKTSCVPVKTVNVLQKDLKETIKGIGTLEALQEVKIRSELAGLIESIHFQEGDEVQQGKILFTIDSDKIRERLRAKQAALEETKAELENAQRKYRRRQKLFEKGLGTEEARDEAKTAYKGLNSTVERLNAEIGEIKEILQDTKVKAPFAGVLTEKFAEPGDWIDVGTPLVSIVQNKKLEISFTVPEKYMGHVKVGQSVEILSQAYPERSFSGEVYFVSPQIRIDTRDLLVKAYVENVNQLLRTGGFASVKLTVDVHKQTPVIPEEALVPTRTGYMVFVVKDSKAKGREVKIGLRKPGVVEIREGLEPGETVVQSGHISVHEGVEVCSVD